MRVMPEGPVARVYVRKMLGYLPRDKWLVARNDDAFDVRDRPRPNDDAVPCSTLNESFDVGCSNGMFWSARARTHLLEQAFESLPAVHRWIGVVQYGFILATMS